MPSYARAILDAGALCPLIALVCNQQGPVAAHAANSIAQISVEAEMKVKAMECGALRALSNLSSRTSCRETQAASTRALSALSEVLTPTSRRVIRHKFKDADGLDGANCNSTRAMILRQRRAGPSPLVQSTLKVQVCGTY